MEKIDYERIRFILREELGRVQTPRQLTVQETASILGVAVKTLANWRSIGTGPRCIRLGQVVRYDPREVDRWIREKAV